MKITIITATYNNASTLETTIKSVVNQSHEEVEYIIVDGASTDGSLDIIKRYALRYPKVIKYISEPDTGVYNAINKGIRMSTGEVIGLLHGNDYFSSTDILSQVAEAMNDNAVPFIYGDVKYTRVGSDKVVRYYSSQQFTIEMLLQGIAPPHP